MTHLTPDEFARRLDEAAVGIDDNRWLLAELALDAKQAEYPNWPALIGRHKRVLRSERTVYQWAQAAEFRDVVGVVLARDANGQALTLPYSFYAEALRYVDRLPFETLRELMQTAALEGVGFEEFRAELKTQAGAPEPDPAKKWRKLSENLYGQVDSHAKKVGAHLSNAALALALAAQALAEPDEPETEGTLDGKPMRDVAREAMDEVAALVNAGALDGNGVKMTATVTRGGRL